MRLKESTWIVPANEMVKAVQATVEKTHGKPGIDNWGEYESSLCRMQLPKQYHHIETDIIKRLAGNIRRNPDKFGYKAPLSKSMGRHGAKHPGGYLEWIQSEQYGTWKQMFAWPFWESVFGCRCCCVCTSTRNLDLHHRTYVRFKSERPSDVVPLCRKHHDLYHEQQSNED